jgi:hypothetical protein
MAAEEVEKAALGDGWRVLFPGKELLARLASRLGISNETILINSLIRTFAAHPERIDPELDGIVQRILQPAGDGEGS